MPRAKQLPSLMDVNAGQEDQFNSLNSLNEDQKKRLPPWIRDGLEKMERAKRKKEEEDMRKQRTDEKKKQQRLEREALAKKDPTVSKFDYSGDESDEDEDMRKQRTDEKKKQR